MLKTILLLISLVATPAYAIDYSDAINHAKDAAMEQSGANTLVHQTENYFKSTYIQPYPWLRVPGSAVYTMYYAFKHRSLPAVPITKNAKLTLSWEAARIEYHF